MKTFAFGTVFTLLLALACSAQEPQKPPASTENLASSYIPDLSELMITTQLRHFKLSYAARVSNWSLATYESALVRKSLNAAATIYPIFRNVQQATLIAGVSITALNAIDKSIKARDRGAFATQFKTLTDACNSCHRQANVEFIIIRAPTSEHFNNQTFPLNNQEFLPNRR